MKHKPRQSSHVPRPGSATGLVCDGVPWVGQVILTWLGFGLGLGLGSGLAFGLAFGIGFGLGCGLGFGLGWR